MEVFRRLLSLAAWLFAALMLYVTMTVPAIAATAPAVLTVGAVAAGWVLWPKRPKTPLLRDQGRYSAK